jgi:hypothetical protein
MELFSRDKLRQGDRVCLGFLNHGILGNIDCVSITLDLLKENESLNEETLLAIHNSNQNFKPFNDDQKEIFHNHLIGTVQTLVKQ